MTDLLKKLACCEMKRFVGTKKPASIDAVFTVFIDSQSFTAHYVRCRAFLLVSVFKYTQQLSSSRVASRI